MNSYTNQYEELLIQQYIVEVLSKVRYLYNKL
jgi:hypothetical protein